MGETMNYYGAKELAESFRTVRKNTIQVAEDIPEDKYGFKVADDVRSVEKMLTHIALTPQFQHQIHGDKLTTLEGFNFPARMQHMMAEEAKPRTKAQVIDMLRADTSPFRGSPSVVLIETGAGWHRDVSRIQPVFECREARLFTGGGCRSRGVLAVRRCGGVKEAGQEQRESYCRRPPCRGPCGHRQPAGLEPRRPAGRFSSVDG